ncbi:MAG: hypothetical protein KBT03_11875 [Bacteroidales bacterium]|nr:hypothetical protein [Candidatus Scybalousia scybalohippi]
MAGEANKIKYGLKNVYVAKCTENIDSVSGAITYTYGTPKAILGAVNLSMSPEGSSDPFHADNMVFFRTNANNGYSGDLEIALIPDWFREEILGEKKDSKGILWEKSDDTETGKFAMMFQFEGDKKATRHVFLYCTAQRPDINGATQEDTVEPQTETMSLNADPRADGWIKGKTTPDTDETAYNSWFTKVQEPNIA